MTDGGKLYIDGKLVTASNAWRFVKKRLPNAEVHRERFQGWRRNSYAAVRIKQSHSEGFLDRERWQLVLRAMVDTLYSAKDATCEKSSKLKRE